MIEINIYCKIEITMNSKSLNISLLKTMLLIRHSEESLVEPIINGDVRCPVHLYSGEEAVATGVIANLIKGDSIFGTHRSHGHYLANGGSLKAMIAEIYGKSTGCSRGRGGSMHLCDPANGFWGAAPIVAGTISLALGAALGNSIKKSDNIAVCFFGDGATGEGVLYESLNFAAVKKLPILFVCENNLYSTHLPIDEIRPNDEIYKIPQPLDIMTDRIDGNDVLAVYETAKRFIDKCRDGEGPAFLECMTYRMRGHVGPDDNIQGTRTDIRPESEIAEWREKDPIQRMQVYLLEHNLISSDEIQIIENQIKSEIEDAYDFTYKSSYPNISELSDYVFKG